MPDGRLDSGWQRCRAILNLQTSHKLKYRRHGKHCDTALTSNVAPSPHSPEESRSSTDCEDACCLSDLGRAPRRAAMLSWPFPLAAALPKTKDHKRPLINTSAFPVLNAPPPSLPHLTHTSSHNLRCRHRRGRSRVKKQKNCVPFFFLFPRLVGAVSSRYELVFLGFNKSVALKAAGLGMAAKIGVVEESGK